MISVDALKAKYYNSPVQAKASFWFLVCSILQKGISVITTPIFTRIMSSGEYGQFNVFTSWQGIITSIIILTLPWGVFEQGLVKFSDEKKTFTSSLLGLMTTLLMIWLLVYVLLHSYINHLLGLTTFQMLLMFSLIWTTSIFSFWSMRQRVEFRYHALVALTLVTSIAKPVLGILLVLHFDDKVTARIISLVAVELLFFTGLFVYMVWQGKRIYSKANWKYALAFNLPLIPHYLSQRILDNSDRIMIKKMVDDESSGIYSLAYSLALLMQMVNVSIRDTLSPWTYKKIKAGHVEDIKRIAYPAMVLVAAVNILLIAFAPEIVKIFAPIEYYDAIWIIPPVAMSVFFMFLYIFFADFELYFEKTKFISIATMIGAVVNLILNFIFIHLFGYYAAGYTTLFCYILYAVMHFLFMRKLCKENGLSLKVYDPKVLFLISIVFMGIGFGVEMTYTHPLVRYSLISILVLSLILSKDRFVSLYHKVKTE